MGIFEEMWDARSFFSRRDYTELRRMLTEAIAGGFVEKIQVMPHTRVWSDTEEWYRDKETGEIYSLTGPGERESGHWERVDLKDLIEPGQKSQ